MSNKCKVCGIAGGTPGREYGDRGYLHDHCAEPTTLACEMCGSNRVTKGDYCESVRIRCNDCNHLEVIWKDNELETQNG